MLFIEVFKTIWDFSFWTENPAVANKKYPHPNTSCCFSPSYHTEPQSSRNFKTPVLPPFLWTACAPRFFPCKTVPRRTEFYSLSIRRGISIMRSCSSYCGSCDPAIHQPVSKPLLDGAVRFFRIICCAYTIADFRSSGTSFSRNAVLRERNAKRPCPKARNCQPCRYADS